MAAVTGGPDPDDLRSALAAMDGDDRQAMQAAGRHAIAYRQGLADAPAVPARRPDAMRGQFGGDLPDTGEPAASVIDRLAADCADGLHAHASPRFFGYVVGGSMPVGVAADTMVAAWGQNSASTWESPAMAEIERTLCRWCLELLDLPRGSGVGVVPGATAANMQAIMAARDALLTRQGWDVEAKGLFGAPEIPVLIGDAAHSAAFAGLRYAGLGPGRAVRVAADDQGRMQIDALRRALDDCASPPLVILQAGQINTGAFDPFAEAVAAVHDRGGWAHVDGAFGLWLRAVPQLRDRLAGVDAADSWAVDLHKWLNAPLDAALCILRDRGALVSAMTARGAYLPDPGDGWEPSDSTIELSRRARGVASYAILRHLGAAGLRAMILRHCALARYLGDCLRAHAKIEVLNDIDANQVAISCGDDETTAAVLQRVHARGKVYPSHGVLNGRKIIRVSIINYATDRADIDLLAAEIVAALP